MFKGEKLFIIAAALFGIAFLLGAYNASGQMVKVGAILPFTGTAAHFGQWMREGTDMAVEEINAAGGISGKKLEMAYEDSRSVPKEGVAAMNKLIFIDKLPVIMTTLTGVTKAVLPIADQNKVVMTTSAILPGLTEGSNYIFRNSVNMQDHSSHLMNFSKERWKRVGILYLNNEVGQWFAKDWRERYPGFGGAILASESFEQGGTDFRVQLTKLKAANPEAIYIYGYREIAFILKQAKELGIKTTFIGGPDFQLPEIIEVAKEAAEGIIYTYDRFDPEVASPSTKEFQNKYKSKYGKLPEVWAAIHYDMIKLIVEGIKKNGYTAEAIRKYLLTVKDYPGASGVTTILPNGDVSKPVVFKTVSAGKYILYR